MERVIPFRAHRGCNGQSEYVRKSFCISIVFVCGFLAFIGGHILGRLSTEREYLLRNYTTHLRTGVGNGYELAPEVDTLNDAIEKLLNFTEMSQSFGNTSELLGVFNCDWTAIPQKLNLNVKEDGHNNTSKTLIVSALRHFVRRATECVTDIHSSIRQDNL